MKTYGAKLNWHPQRRLNESSDWAVGLGQTLVPSKNI